MFYQWYIDDALLNMNVTYLRYQDDILILCKTKRQLNRCRRCMMEVLHERRLTLSRKKSRIGSIDRGFHFLGIHYPGTQTLRKTNVLHANDDSITQADDAYYLSVICVGNHLLNNKS